MEFLTKYEAKKKIDSSMFSSWIIQNHHVSCSGGNSCANKFEKTSVSTSTGKVAAWIVTLHNHTHLRSVLEQAREQALT